MSVLVSTKLGSSNMRPADELVFTLVNRQSLAAAAALHMTVGTRLVQTTGRFLELPP